VSDTWNWREQWLPLVLALAVHAVAILALYDGWNPDFEVENVVAPKFVNSTLIVMEPKSKPKPAAKPQQKEPEPLKPIIQQQVAPPPPKPVPKTTPTPVKTEVKPDPEAIRRKAEQEAKRKAEALRQQRLQELADQSFEDALADEQENLDDFTEEGEAAKSYFQAIYDQVVNNWSRPPSARNGMKALLRVDLVPTGDLVNVTVIESSGNPAFDRSAEQAVRKAGKFEVPKESALFESKFRRFNLLFQPEDLFR
jgi:colicin import membrane protein